ncbi:MAG: phosphotransferase family protein [Actinomycetota bacterium]|nr:phosphotransferase family protein [Actinomycetota bacterium]
MVETTVEAEGLSQPPLIIRGNLEDFLPGNGSIEVERLGDGHSNATFVVKREEKMWVLRRPPRPPYPPKAHDVLREAAILESLEQAAVPVPRVAQICEDENVIGAPFYLMEKMPGFVIRDEIPEGLPENPGEAIGESLISGLATIHGVDWKKHGFPAKGNGEGYLERQVALWGAQWVRNRTREVPVIDEVGRRLAGRIPASGAPTIVHGDYKLDNVLFSEDEFPKLTAVLDWEMATVGDPIADLGFLTATWLGPNGDPDNMVGLSRATASPSFPTAAWLADRYSELTGRDLGALGWYEALALWKLAILLEGSYRRFIEGTDDDPFFARLESGVPHLGDLALDRLS